jgi:hypothetical protein
MTTTNFNFDSLKDEDVEALLVRLTQIKATRADAASKLAQRIRPNEEEEYHRMDLEQVQSRLEGESNPILKAIAQHDFDLVARRERRNKAAWLNWSPTEGKVVVHYHRLAEEEVVTGVTQADWDAIPLSNEHGWVRVDDHRLKFVAECGNFWN